MSDKKWKPISWFGCPACRGELEAFTEAEEDFFFGGDPVQCTNCGWEGRIIIVDNEAWVEEIGLYDDNAAGCAVALIIMMLFGLGLLIWVVVEATGVKL